MCRWRVNGASLVLITGFPIKLEVLQLFSQTNQGEDDRPFVFLPPSCSLSLSLLYLYCAVKPRAGKSQSSIPPHSRITTSVATSLPAFRSHKKVFFQLKFRRERAQLMSIYLFVQQQTELSEDFLTQHSGQSPADYLSIS